MSADVKEPDVFEVFVSLVKGEAFKKLDILSESDPYVVFKLVDIVHTSTTKKDDAAPVWNEGFQFFLQKDEQLADKTLFIETYDRDPIGSDFIGGASVKLEDVWKRRLHRIFGWFELKDREGRNSGKLFLEVKIFGHFWELDYTVPAPITPLTSPSSPRPISSSASASTLTTPPGSLSGPPSSTSRQSISRSPSNPTFPASNLPPPGPTPILTSTSSSTKTEIKYEIPTPPPNYIRGGSISRKRMSVSISNVINSNSTPKVSAEQCFIWQAIEGIKLAAREAADAQTYKKPRVEEAIYNISPPVPGVGGVLTVLDYAPSTFLSIKSLHTSVEEYIKSWTFHRAEDIPQPELGAGRSGSLFMLSHDKRFIFKSLPQHEVETLRAVLEAYGSYISKNQGSRLMRIFALHAFHNPEYNNYFYLVVANNILFLPLGRAMLEKYDLKGRAPKHRPKAPSKGNIWKDNQLDRKFHLDKESKDQLLSELHKDATFLDAQNMMDYSLLVGVSAFESDDFQRKIEWSFFLKETKEEKESGPKLGALGHGQPANLQVAGSEVHQSNFNVGIVDFLSRYGIAKATAHFFKSMIWKDETLSTVPAKYYAKRFTDYLPTIFTVCDSSCSLSSSTSTSTTTTTSSALLVPSASFNSSISPLTPISLYSPASPNSRTSPPTSPTASSSGLASSSSSSSSSSLSTRKSSSASSSSPLSISILPTSNTLFSVSEISAPDRSPKGSTTSSTLSSSSSTLHPTTATYKQHSPSKIVTNGSTNPYSTTPGAIVVIHEASPSDRNPENGSHSGSSSSSSVASTGTSRTPTGTSSNSSNSNSSSNGGDLTPRSQASRGSVFSRVLGGVGHNRTSSLGPTGKG